ncbi:MAG: hypothetical protein AAGJ31_02925 [Verrucomicrobiota bacterium]
MDPLWLLFPVFLVLFWLWDKFDKLIERPMNRLLCMVGLDLDFLHGGIGPLESSAIVQDERMTVRVKNVGHGRFRLGSLVGIGSGRKPYLPVPYLRQADFGDSDPDMAIRKEFASTILKPGESLEFTLNVSELVESDCKQLKLFNTRGRSWPVEGLPDSIST